MALSEERLVPVAARERSDRRAACLRHAARVPSAEQDDHAPSPDDNSRRFALTRSPHAGDFGGFGIHAGVTVAAGDPEARARLVRYCARAPLSLERLSVFPARPLGQIARAFSVTLTECVATVQ